MTHYFLLSVKTKLKLNKKDFKLLLEAYRRKHLIDGATVTTEFLGLGTPHDYKSTYFTCATGRVVARIRNWYKLTEQGEDMMKKLEVEIPVNSFNKFDFNAFLFLY